MADTQPNPFYGSSPLGDALKNLGKVIMSGPTDAERIIQAEQALKLQQGRTYGNSVAEGIRRIGTAGYDPRETAANAWLARDPAMLKQLPETQLYVTANTPNSAPSAVDAAARGAGQAYNSTQQGQRDITDRGIAQQRYQFDNTFETLRDPSGKLVPVPRNQVTQMVQQGYTVQPTIDQVKANVLTSVMPNVGPQPTASPGVPQSAQPYMAAPLPQSAPTAPPQAPGAVSTDPIYNLPPSAQSMLGVSKAPVPMVDTKTNRSGLSFDGGHTVVDQANGKLEQVAGGGWITAGPETAVAESRTAMAKNNAMQPGQFPPWSQGSYAQGASKAAGVDAFGQKHLNALLGSIGLAGPGGEIGPNYERARARLNIINQTIIGAFTNSPTSPIKEQAHIREMLPSDAIITNPTTEANRVGSLVQYLQDDNQRLRSLIASPGVTGPMMQQAQQALIANEKALTMVTAPAQGAPGGGVAPPPSAPPGASQPPAPGARQAPDGNWYVSDPARPGKYLQVR